MKRLIASLLWLIALSILPAHGAPLEKQRVVLAVGGKTTLYYLPLTLADRLGYVADEGLDVEINDFPGGSRALQALIGHSADVVSGAYEHTIVMVPPEYLLGDKALYAASFERLRPTYSTDGVIPKKGVDNSYKVLLAHNPAVRRAPVVWIKQTYTNAFVEKALQKYR